MQYDVWFERQSTFTYIYVLDSVEDALQEGLYYLLILLALGNVQFNANVFMMPCTCIVYAVSVADGV